jgi:hypothetical protein
LLRLVESYTRIVKKILADIGPKVNTYDTVHTNVSNCACMQAITCQLINQAMDSLAKILVSELTHDDLV